MKWATGVIAAPRPIPGSLRVTVDSLKWNDWHPTIFAEPNTQELIPECQTIFRPLAFMAQHPELTASPEGVLGNFQNYIQAASDLLMMHWDAEAILITEDDALICRGAREFIEPKLWAVENCGAYSLYTPNMQSYRDYYAKEIVNPKTPVMGSLAMIWRPEVLRQVIQSEAVLKWAGSAKDQIARKTQPWQRAGVDTFLGQEIRRLGYHVRMFTRSLVKHHFPDGGVNNSACDNGPATGKRAEYSWVGESPDLKAVFSSNRLGRKRR